MRTETIRKICERRMEIEGKKTCRGNAAQFLVAAELSRRGLVAAITLGNCPNTDILCSNTAGTRFAHIQVKTFVPGTRSCTVGMKAEREYAQGFFWVLVGVPMDSQDGRIQYYIIPSSIMAPNVIECFKMWSEAKGQFGLIHDPENTIRSVRLPPHRNRNGWELSKYLGAWHFVDEQLAGVP
jgi:hypothetical protein